MKNTSETLKREAEELLKMWDLFGYLNKFGEPYVVGSVAMNLMVWRDIDLVIISNKPVKRESAIEIASHIYENEHVRKVSIVDERLVENPRKPEGIYIGIEYVTDNLCIWKIDIWYLTPEKDMSIAKTKDILSKLTANAREKILDIKSQVYDNPNYRKNVTSVDIYEAVLEKGINNLEEFKSYLKDTKNILL